MAFTGIAPIGTRGHRRKCWNRAGIEGIASRRVGKCPEVNQQRLRFAMAALSDPRLLIWTNQTTGMDVEGVAILAAIREDAKRGARSLFFATHYLDEAMLMPIALCSFAREAWWPTAPRRKSRPRIRTPEYAPLWSRPT